VSLSRNVGFETIMVLATLALAALTSSGGAEAKDGDHAHYVERTKSDAR
jgi:hypothetical protein